MVVLTGIQGVVYGREQSTYLVQTKKMARSPLQYDGILAPLHSVPIKQPENAYIHKEYFKMGDHIKKGEQVVEWISPELLNQFYQANREYIDTEEMLHRLKAWEKSGAMMQAKRDLIQAQHLVDEAKHRHGQTKRLYEAGIVSKEELNIDHRSYEQAVKNLEQAQYDMSQAKRKGAKLEVGLAQMKYNVAKERYTLLKKQVEALKFNSPIDGVLIPSSESDETEYGVLISPLQWKVLVKVNEWDAVMLQNDQIAEIKITALDNRMLKGKIDKISIQPIDGFDKNTIPRYEVTISINSELNDLADSLRLGMTALVSCQFPKTEGLFVPKQAVSIDESGPFVNLMIANNELIKQHVEIGNNLENEVQITKGIKEGDSLVLFG